MSNYWTIRQRVDLARGYIEPRVLPGALMMQGDKLAHEWQVTVQEDGQAAILTGTVRGYFQREGDATDSFVTVTGSLVGNVAKVQLKSECYAKPGPLTCVMRLASMDGSTLTTLGVLCANVGRQPIGTVIDPEHIVPDLEVLLAKISACEAATSAASQAENAAKTAATTANQAASAANTAADTAVTTANQAASAANTAAASAQTVAEKFSAIAVEVQTLPPSAEATGSAAQTAKKTTFSFGIPTSNLAYATFEIDDNGDLYMISPDGFNDIGFKIDDADDELYVIIGK
ncbi:MAG: hypothetical protein RSE23_01850 [Clostridia bacterium]